MALRYPIVADGLWSNPTTWFGNNIPAAGDFVHANGFRTLVNVITPSLLYVANTQYLTTLSSGGYFELQTNSKITTSNPSGVIATANGSAGVIRCPVGVTASCEVNATECPTTTANAVSLIQNNGGTLTLTGLFSMNNAANTGLTKLLDHQSGITIINGPVSSAQTTNGANRIPIYINSGTVTINGNITCSQQASVNNRTVYMLGGTLNVGPSGGGGITSVITAGTAGAIYAINPSNIIMNINANINTTGLYPAIYVNGQATIDINGTVTCNVNSPSVVSNSVLSTIRVTGTIANAQGTMAIVGCRYIYLNSTVSTSNNWIFQKSSDGSNITYKVETTTPVGDLSSINVRQGNTTGNIVGNMVVPVNTNVRFGTAVDAYGGVGTLKVEDAYFWNVLTTGITTSNSMGLRLKTVSTVSTLGTQLTSYNG